MLSVVDICDDVLFMMFDNLYDIIQLKNSCWSCYKSLKIKKLLMNAKYKKVHLLKDIYYKLPCWNHGKMMFPQMTHKDQLFCFQLGCNKDPIEIRNLYSRQPQLDVKLSSDNIHMLLKLCHNVNKANNNTLHVFDEPIIYIDKKGSSYFRKQSGNMESCLHYHINYSKEKICTSLIVSIHISNTAYHTYDTPIMLAKPFIYFVAHECLIFS